MNRSLEHDWLGVCRRSAAAIGRLLDATPGGAARVEEVGTIGAGGDRTLVIDAAAEQCVFDELGSIHAQGANFTAISEERGVVEFGGGELIVVIDPIDGSLNAKRTITHHALSIAVANGPTMADVQLGFVFDFGTGDEWRAARGEGAYLNDAPITAGAERRTEDGRLEVVAIESAAPRWLAAASNDLLAAVYRVRALGTIAIALCQVAAGRVDGMASLRGCRAIDAAAAQLIIREAGGLVRFLRSGTGGTGDEDPLAAPLDLPPHGPVVAALTERGLSDVARLPVV